MAEVLVEGRRLDVNEGLDFSFNYSIADIRDPNKRSTSFSKTIKCPASKNNDILFGQIYDVNISNDFNPSNTNIEVNFNPNKKAKATVIHDGVTVMEGVVQLRAVTINNGRYDYEVVFIGELVSFFSELGKSKLTEIDFSDLNHIYNATNVSNSWSNTDGYVYPMIDYGDNFDVNNGLNAWTVRDFRPAVYAKTILDRIFDFANFTYTSTFLNSSPFTNLIIPFAGEQLQVDDSITESRKFRASQVGVEGAYAVNDFVSISQTDVQRVLRLTNDSTNGNFDNGNNFDTTTWSYTVPENGLYSFSTSAEINLARAVINTNIYSGVLGVKLRIIKVDTSANLTVEAETIQGYEFSGSPTVFDETLSLSTTTPETIFLSGDVVAFRLVLSYADLQITSILGSPLSFSTLFTDFDLTTQSASSFVTPSQNIFEGDTININSTIADVRMVDLMLSFIKMFNLYVTPDPDNDRNLIIETREQYYSGGTTRDWSKKLARDKTVSLKPLGLLSAREYIYKYKEDKDYYNERYQTTHLEPYGTRDVEIDNDFLNNDKEVELIFSPTPLQIEGNSDRFVSRIYDDDISEGSKPTESNIRILYYRRTICIPDWQFYSEIDGLISNEIVYPYAGHLDSPRSPSFDLNFGIPQELFYQGNGFTGTLQYTNANLYRLYHKAFIDEITDKDSKLMTGEFYLDASDIHKLDFRDQILIDNAYWRLNKVRDYNPFKEGLTTVELFKVKDIIGQEVEPAQSFAVGSIGFVGGERKPHVNRKTKQDSHYNFYAGKVNGIRNNVSPLAQEFSVIGNNNFIGDSSKNISILGNNNYVTSGVENVVIVNSNNQEVYTSNTTIIDGKKQWTTVEKDVDYSAEDRDFVLADSSKAAPPITITLPEMAEGLWVAVKKVDATAGAVDIDPFSGVGLIDGAASHTLSHQYDSVELFCDGSNWYIRSDK